MSRCQRQVEYHVMVEAYFQKSPAKIIQGHTIAVFDNRDDAMARWRIEYLSRFYPKSLLGHLVIGIFDVQDRQWLLTMRPEVN
jgi:hypothetical protein